jgi:glycosyltransferase involved in cell wall biosynthesis
MTSISVIICTFNRCDSLVDTLHSLSAMRVPDDIDWNVLVVDNNSTDRTRERVLEVAGQTTLPLTYLRQPIPGLSHARNLGITSTDKEYIAFTDDDVLVGEDWLAQIVQTFRANNADCVGGKVVPYWIEPRPEWLTDNLLNVLAMLDHGDAPFQFGERDHRILFGANFSFRRECLTRLGMFNVDLGRKGAFGVGEDKAIFHQLTQSGGRAFYNPAIVVRHKVPPDRMEKRYFRQWYYVAGRDRAKITNPSRFTVLGIESFLLANFAKAASALLASAVRGSDSLFADELACILYLSVFKHKIVRA